MLRKQRLVTAAGITAFWLIMVGAFIHREGWFSARELPAEQPTFRPQDQWMGIYVAGDKRVGYVHLKSDEATRYGLDGYTLDLSIRLETSLFGTLARMDVEGLAWTAVGGTRSEFDFSLNSGEFSMGIQGAVEDSRLKAKMRTGGEVIPLDVPVESALFPGGGLGMPTAGMPLLEPGESATVEAFDPMTMKVGEATIECVGRETVALEDAVYETKVYTTTIGTITNKAWVTANDEVVQATTPFGFTLRKIAPEALSTPVVAANQGDMIQSLAIFPTGQPVPENATYLEVRVSGVAPETIPHEPPWQTRDGDRVEIRQPDPMPDPAATVPAPSFDVSPYLQADVFADAEHPDIIAKAREIVGDEPNPWRQAVLLYEWLYENVEKTPVLSIPQALDVLKYGKGDCNEHTVFFAALARSLGIPTRIAIGIVYSDAIGGFGYHAWPEVYYGRWYPMDPTLGQVVADATHIKLFDGGIEKWMQLTGFVGQMELEVLAAE